MFFVLIIVISFIATDIWHDQQHWVLKKIVCINQVVGIMSFPPQFCSATCRCECWQTTGWVDFLQRFPQPAIFCYPPRGISRPWHPGFPWPSASWIPAVQRIWPASSPAVGKRMSLAASGLATTSGWKISPPWDAKDIKQPNNHETNHLSNGAGFFPSTVYSVIKHHWWWWIHMFFSP